MIDCTIFTGVRWRDRRIGHTERGLVQGLDTDHAAPERQPDSVDVRHAGRRWRARRGWRQLISRRSPKHTRLFSLVFYKKRSNIRECRAARVFRRWCEPSLVKNVKMSFAADLHVPSKIKCYVSSLTVLYFCIYTGLQISSWPDEYKYL